MHILVCCLAYVCVCVRMYLYMSTEFCETAQTMCSSLWGQGQMSLFHSWINLLPHFSGPGGAQSLVDSYAGLR